MFNLCAPAIIYGVFSLCQIIIDLFSGLYNTAIMKFVISVLILLLINGLCQSGLTVVSWIIVFVPFILMTFIVAMLLYIFGLNIASGSQNQKQPILQNAGNSGASGPASVEGPTIVAWVPLGSSSPAYQS
jgi:hypothetical protein